MQQLPQSAQRQSRVTQCKGNAHRGGSRHRHRIGKSVSLPQIVAQSQQNQHNRHGINGVQDGDGNAQNHAQPQIAHQKREKRDDIHPRPIGNFPEKGGKILRNGVDQAYAGGQAGQREDGRQQHRTGAAKHLIDDAPQRPRAVLLNRVNAGAAHAHVGQHCIHHRQNRPGQHARQNRVAHFVFLLRQAERPQGRGDHQPKIQGGNGVHGVVALGEALEQRRLPVSLLRRRDVSLSPEQEADEQQRQQCQQRRGKSPADPIDQLSGVQAQPQGDQKEAQRIDRHPQRRIAPLRQIGRHRHFKGDGSGSGNSQSRSDGQVDQHGKHQGKARPHLPAQLFQPVKPRDHHHAKHRQHHRRYKKPDHGRQGFLPGVLPQKRRKNQISRPKKQGKQHNTDHQQTLFTQFHFPYLFF